MSGFNQFIVLKKTWWSYEWIHGTHTSSMITVPPLYQLGRWSWNNSHHGAHRGRAPCQSGQRTPSITVSWYSGRTGGLLNLSVPSEWTLHLQWRKDMITPIWHILRFYYLHITTLLHKQFINYITTRQMGKHSLSTLHPHSTQDFSRSVAHS